MGGFPSTPRRGYAADALASTPLPEQLGLLAQQLAAYVDRKPSDLTDISEDDRGSAPALLQEVTALRTDFGKLRDFLDAVCAAHAAREPAQTSAASAVAPEVASAAAGTSAADRPPVPPTKDEKVDETDVGKEEEDNVGGGVVGADGTVSADGVLRLLLVALGSQQVALGALVAREHELSEHLEFTERTFAELKQLGEEQQRQQQQQAVAPAAAADGEDDNKAALQQPGFTMTGGSAHDPQWFVRFVLEPAASRLALVREDLSVTMEARANGLANLLRLRAEAQAEHAAAYGRRVAAVEAAFEAHVMRREFSLRATFPRRELVTVEDPRELEEARLEAERRALAKGGATSKARGTSPPARSGGGARGASKAKAKGVRRQGDGSGGGDERGPAAAAAATPAASAAAAGSVVEDHEGEEEGKEEEEERQATEEKAAGAAVASPARLARDRNVVGAATVLRHVRDVVDRLAKFADEGRPVGLDDSIVLRQPMASSRQDTRAVAYALQLRHLAQQARGPAERFARRLLAASREGPLLFEEVAASTPTAPVPSPVPGVGWAPAGRERVASRVAPMRAVFDEAFAGCNGDFARLTSLLRVTVEVPSLARVHAVLKTLLTREMRRLSGGAGSGGAFSGKARSPNSSSSSSSSSAVGDNAMHGRVGGHDDTDDDGNADDLAALADVLSFCLAPTSVGQLLHAARGAAALPCRQRLGAATAVTIAPAFSEGGGGGGVLPARPAHYRMNRPSLHRDGAERFGVVLAARLRAPLPSQTPRTGKARGTAGRHGFIFELEVVIPALNAAAAASAAAAGTTASPTATATAAAAAAADFDVARGGESGGVGSALGRAAGGAQPSEALRLFDQHTLYPLVGPVAAAGSGGGGSWGPGLVPSSARGEQEDGGGGGGGRGDGEDWASYGLMNPGFLEPDAAPPPPPHTPVRAGLQCVAAALAAQVKADGMAGALTVARARGSGGGGGDDDGGGRVGGGSCDLWEQLCDAARRGCEEQHSAAYEQVREQQERHWQSQQRPPQQLALVPASLGGTGLGAGGAGFGLLRSVSLSQCGLTLPMVRQFCGAFLLGPAPPSSRSSSSPSSSSASSSSSSWSSSSASTPFAAEGKAGDSGRGAHKGGADGGDGAVATRGGRVAFLDVSQNPALVATAAVLCAVGAAFPNLRKFCADRCALTDALPGGGGGGGGAAVAVSGQQQQQQQQQHEHEHKQQQLLWQDLFGRLRRGLTLAYNGLRGRLPAGLLGAASHLTQLWLNDNALTGPVPSAVGGLASLQVLMLQNNQLTGRLPTELGRCAQLTELNIQSNALTGPLPPELGELQLLRLLNLRGNRLTGVLPEELCGMAELQHAILADNRLTGPVPPGIFLLPSLWQLWLNGNRLSGPLPEASRDNVSLNMLILEDNELSGKVPLSWTEFARLSVLRVGGNRGLVPHREVELVLGKKWKTLDNAGQVTKFMRALKKQRRKAEDAAKGRFALK